MTFQKLLLIVAFAFSFVKGHSQTFELNDASLNDYLGESLLIYEDESGALRINEVMPLPNDSFTQIPSRVPNLQISKSAFWAKIEFTNNTSFEDLLLTLSLPAMDRVDFYHVKNGAIVDSINLGQYQDFSDRLYQDPWYIMPLGLVKGETRTYFMRVEAIEQVQLPIKVDSEKSTFETLKAKDFFVGSYVGLMVVLVLYNLFIFISVRDRSYLFYVIYIGIMIIMQSASFGWPFEYLWPNSPGFDRLTFIIFPVAIGLAFFEFAKSFLNVREVAPRMIWGFHILTAVFVVVIGLALAGELRAAYQLIQINSASLSIYGIIVGVVVLRRGSRIARFYLVAFTLFLSGIVVFIMKDVGVLPYNNVTNYMMPFCSALEGILLSFGLADRINVLKREKEESQQQALETSQENERIIREQNVVLEQKVLERTAELQESNEELNVTLQHLKETQSQLVDAEKMASLGQLTAGIAHEINNPINFVAANVKPLRRDLEDIMQVMDRYAALTPESDISEELEKINDLKEELDTDFLKEEMEMLLQGIDEGASRTAEIVKGLRLFSRLDEPDLKKANMNEGLDATLILVRNNMEGNCEVVKNYDEIPLIDCYPGKLNQVFMNIINNGIQSINTNREKNPEGVLTLSTKADQSHIYVTIADNGIGMDEATKAKIFEPFFTTKDVGEGTGLGLSIVYKIIESHNGAISVESSPGEGAAFTIKLPIKNETSVVN